MSRTDANLDERGLPPGYPFKPDLEVTPRRARAMVREFPAQAVLIDCRTPDEARVARIAEATLVPLSEIESRAEEIAEMAKEAGDAQVIVHCHHGGRSMKAALALRARGLKEVFSMAGGIDLWSLAVDPAVPRYDK
ncbi:MAG: rhodanese [Phycisphaerales bacterium]|nr:rhodanese [Phycisphaerales bacterium]